MFGRKKLKDLINKLERTILEKDWRLEDVEQYIVKTTKDAKPTLACPNGCKREIITLHGSFSGIKQYTNANLVRVDSSKFYTCPFCGFTKEYDDLKYYSIGEMKQDLVEIKKKLEEYDFE